MSEEERKFHSLLELGQLINLDLQLNEMLLRIAEKACEVMEADRCAVFLYDPKTTVALGMGEEVIRIPSSIGIAGACFQTEKTINLENVYQDTRFNKEVDSYTGYHTHSLLCMPLYTRVGSILGVIQLLNKKEGVFNEEDEAFLRIFANHVSVFIEIAQLHQARIEALEQSQKELELLNKAKSKALDHLSHELRTPLSVIQGNLRLLKRKFQTKASHGEGEKSFETLERNLDRLTDIQQETDKIIRSYQELEREHISLLSFAERILEKAKQKAAHRKLHFQLAGEQGLSLSMAPEVLEDILGGLIKNAIENTPDEGEVCVTLKKVAADVLLQVTDYGVGIPASDRDFIFKAFHQTRETQRYSTRRPFDFNAGGKGLELMRLKLLAEEGAFDISFETHRCRYIPSNQDECPGRISSCPHVGSVEDCKNSGGTTFSVLFSKRRGNSSVAGRGEHSSSEI